MKLKPCKEIHGHTVILYDCGSAEEAVLQKMFNPDWLRQEGLLFGSALGRGEVFFLRFRGEEMVLRHYRRGGVIARLMGDRYFGWRIDRSRPWREWQLLAQLYEKGLPVPRPVAARVVRSWCTYKADLVTCKIDGIPISRRLLETPLEPSSWREIGKCLRQFHENGVYHADLNAHNILIDPDKKIFILDFDRGAIRVNDSSWKKKNLNRLHRSLMKLRNTGEKIYFVAEDWGYLLEGYG